MVLGKSTKAELVSNDYLKERVMSKVFTDKEILDFVENNLVFNKNDAGELTLVNVNCDVKSVSGDVGFVFGNVVSIHGDVQFVGGDVRIAGSVSGAVFSIT